MIYLLIFRGGRNEINTFWYCDNRRTAFGLNAGADFCDTGDDCEAACAAGGSGRTRTGGATFRKKGVTQMNFEQNLFISYTHIDNQPLTDGEKGWITRFHLTLNALLSMRLGRDAKIWRDEKLCGNDVFSDEIVARFKQSAVLVSIVSSRYLNSEWCTRPRILSERAADRRAGGRQQIAGVQGHQDAR